MAVRLIPIALIVILTFLLNRDLDKLEDRKENLTKKWFGKVIWFLFGWTFKLKEFGVVLRILATGAIIWWIINSAVVYMLK